MAILNQPTPAQQQLIERMSSVTMNANPADLKVAATNFLMMSIIAAGAVYGENEHTLIKNTEQIAEQLIASVKANKNFFTGAGKRQ